MRPSYSTETNQNTRNMADISKIKLPSGNEYYLKDEVARQAITGGISFIVAWNGESVPVPANIPAGVVVTYNGTEYTGTLAANNAQAGAFYLLKRSNAESTDNYSEYVAVGASGAKTWEKLGDVQIDLSSLGALAYKNNVSLIKGAKQSVNALTEISIQAPETTLTEFSTVDVLGAETEFNVTQPTLTVTPSKKKLETTQVPNVTNAGSPSTWGFSMGSGNDAETLIITGANGNAPTLGTPITAATGAISANGAGADIVDGIADATATGTAVNANIEGVVSVNIPSGATTTAPQLSTKDKIVEYIDYDDISIEVV